MWVVVETDWEKKGWLAEEEDVVCAVIQLVHQLFGED